VRSLGADVVVDYRQQDFADVLSGYDVVLDSLGGENLEKSLTVLKPGGVFGEILYFAEHVERRTTTVTAKTRITALQIKAGALRAATPACQVGFNKAFMRVLVERLGQANRQLAQR